MAEYLDMAKHIQEAISALTDATEGLRTVTLLTVAAIAKQPNIDGHKFMDDISLMIENHYPPEDEIPLVVLDFRAELARRLSTKE
jgi:hypothetical protein